ncbi:serine hydrolase [Phytoactinopolyspora alkaliphila]|uniref:Serine hydrolase n=1 Tax=Phytoactinopolyspora alkaliphila TaxID=1783498 RepID=A0A6N9YUK2_9ACTN|nr:serine hydrolase [Phytoactinopolyspora alkaliphila]NED98479.1 serine hydrolase [Phytoactinopolyspora alkaliphila]
MPAWPRHSAGTLGEQLAGLAAESPGTWAFAVREQGRAVASVRGDVVVPAASTIKVALMVLALQDVEAERCRLDSVLRVPDERVGGSGVLRLLPSVRALRLDETLELMIGISDNTAANMVIGMLGVDDVARRVAALGARNTRLERRLMDLEAARQGRDNVTTADDQALLLDLLAGETVLSVELRQHALEILGRQQVNDRMPAALGPDVVCRHKTGELEGVRHDVGLLEFDGRQVAFAALGTDLPEQAAGGGPAGSVIAGAARMVVDAARAR